MREETSQEISKLREETSQEISKLRGETTQSISDAKSDNGHRITDARVSMVLWMVGTIMAAGGAMYVAVRDLLAIVLPLG